MSNCVPNHPKQNHQSDIWSLLDFAPLLDKFRMFFALRAFQKLWITINSKCLMCNIYQCGHNFLGHLDLTNFGCQTFVQLHFSLILAIHFPLFSLILNNFPLQKLRNNEIINLTKNTNLGFRYLIISISMTFYLFVVQTASKSFQGLNLKKAQLVPKIYSHPDERLLELELTDNHSATNLLLPLLLLMEKNLLLGNSWCRLKKSCFKCKKIIQLKERTKQQWSYPAYSVLKSANYFKQIIYPPCLPHFTRLSVT